LALAVPLRGPRFLVRRGSGFFVSRHRACGEHSNIQGMSSSMKSFMLADRSTTKTGCRWFGLSSICSRLRSRHASTRSLHSGGFISPPLRLTKSATGIVRSQSFGDGPTDAFTSRLVGSQTAGLTTDHRSRFVRSLALRSPSSHSFSDSWANTH